ncbi:hypothetical protein [Ekhidna sp.]
MISLQSFFFQIVLLTGCANADTIAEGKQADVEKVTASGSDNNFTFSVTISSPDTGCDQYADWWEVVSESGELLYRRILLHSHTNEQPFSRSGGPVRIAKNEIVWVRAHMNNSGYGGQAMKGSVAQGFAIDEIPEGLGDGLDTVAPLPSNCAF